MSTGDVHILGGLCVSLVPHLADFLSSRADLCGCSCNLNVLVTTNDALGHFQTGYFTVQWEEMGHVGSARY